MKDFDEEAHRLIQSLECYGLAGRDPDGKPIPLEDDVGRVAAVILAAVEAEREACAVEVEKDHGVGDPEGATVEAADAIRARGKS
jgi:hypothetical protein